MKRFVSVVFAATLALAVGCGKDSAKNKDLKPVDPGAAKPQLGGGDSQGEKGGKKESKGESPAPVIK